MFARSFRGKILKNTGWKKALAVALVTLFGISLFFYILADSLLTKYTNFESVVVSDRNGATIATKPNSKGNYAYYFDSLPARFRNLLVQKEDRFFYVHPGVNPVSGLRALSIYFKTGTPGASSTITEQLTKNLLGNEQDRTIANKFEEILYSLALELFLSKEKILTMYGNTVYMGNNIQGFGEAAGSYFGKTLQNLSDTEILSLLATISSPSTTNPWKMANRTALQQLGGHLHVATDPESLAVRKSFHALTDTDFELEPLGKCEKSCVVTLDKDISDTLRDILKRNITITSGYGGRNGAIVVIKLPENELLAAIGTPDTRTSLSGSAINMTREPRPIGSTIKPFVYLEGFAKGLRPYTLVDDREYKFSIANGFPLYPKNYDGQYRGTVTLHEALSNSLNVPTVKTLEYITLPAFYSFLEQKLRFKPLQPVDSYQYGIALGGLEMTPLTLAHFMTVFGNHGELLPLRLYSKTDQTDIVPPMEVDATAKHIGNEPYVQLVNKILTDRIAGVEQFGLAGNLNLPQTNYAVKTGTSRDFHDTWAIGYTPDFLVAVWLGNVENEPMRQITSSSGAGKIWHDAMELLMNSPYNKKTPFDFSALVGYQFGEKVEYGLPGDDVLSHTNLLAEQALILNPHDGDTFSFEPDMYISLKATALTKWYADSQFIAESTEVSFHPAAPATYTFRATGADKDESVTIRVVKQ